MYIDIVVLIIKCLILSMIWATFIMPMIFSKGNPLKYILIVIVLTVVFYLLRGYAYIINQMTIVALIALVIAWITSMAFFSKESRIKSKVVAFASIISGLSYLVATLFVHVQIL